MPASALPIDAQYSSSVPVATTRAVSANDSRGTLPPVSGRNASATSSSTDARPALKRKNLMPAPSPTSRRVKAMPIPRCVRKRKRTEVNYPSRRLTSSQLMTLNQAEM